MRWLRWWSLLGVAAELAGPAVARADAPSPHAAGYLQPVSTIFAAVSPPRMLYVSGGVHVSVSPRVLLTVAVGLLYRWWQVVASREDEYDFTSVFGTVGVSIRPWGPGFGGFLVTPRLFGLHASHGCG